MEKTNVMRLLEAAHIPFTVGEYPVDESDLTGVHAAEMLGIEPSRLFKTLVLHGEKNGDFVCCIPADMEVDLRKAAKAAGEKKAELIPMKDLLPKTGYIRGGCSPIGMKKQLPTFVDELCGLYETVYVSAGVRGKMVCLDPQTLCEYVKATQTDLCL